MLFPHLDILLCLVSADAPIVVEQFDDEIDMCEQHTPAAVSRQPKLVEGDCFSLVSRQRFQERLPFVADDLPTCEAANWEDLYHPVRPYACSAGACVSPRSGASRERALTIDRDQRPSGDRVGHE